MRNKAVPVFLICTVVLILPVLWVIATTGRLDLHMRVNGWHATWADRLMPAFTELANGWMPAALALLLLRRSWRAFLMMGLSTGLGSLAVQSLKHGLFADVDRPSAFIARMPGLHLVPDVDLHRYFSFPSGHSTAAFGLCFALAVVIERRSVALLLAIVAAMLAFSRVYLSQHFTEDAVAGAIVGTGIAYGVYRWLYHGRVGARTSLDRSPFKRYSAE